MKKRRPVQLLEQRYLPSLFNGLVKAMNAAPPESEEKTRGAARDANTGGQSGRNDEVVKQYGEPVERKVPRPARYAAQLMSHL